jgi:hypothetical protein
VTVDSIENLRKKLHRKLQFTLSHPVETIVLPGAELANHEKLDYEFIITGDVRQVLRNLSELPVISVTMPEPSLDEIFMQYYKNGNDD